MRRLLHRALQAVFLLFGVSVLVFLFSTLAPGNYLDEMRLNPQISPATLASLRAQYQLDKPLPVRYARWVASVAHGELGYSFAYNTPVAPLLWTRAKNTLALTLSATLLAWALALPLGVWSADKVGCLPDRAVSLATSVLLVVPELALALGLLILAARTRWLPTGGLVSAEFASLSAWGKLSDVCRHMVLPVSVLVLGMLPVLVRHIRAAVAEALRAPSLRSALASGLPHRKLLYHYALLAAANPLVSLFGFSIGALLSGSLLVEIVMSWPGIGPLLLEAILARDLYVVIAGVFFSTIFLVAGNLLADVLLFWMDPRIGTGESQ